MIKQSRPALAALAAAAMIAPSAAVALPASAARAARIARLSEKVQQLQQQVAALKAAVGTPAGGRTPTPGKNSLSFNGGVEMSYQYFVHGVSPRTAGGDAYLQDVSMGASGRHGPLSFDASYWLVGGGDSFLASGSVRYRFGARHRQSVRGGLIRMPFGNLPAGYLSYYGNLAYETGFTDNQAAGLGYTYAAGPWRVDLDVFRNHNLGQPATYGADPALGYQSINGGNARLAYTMGAGSADHATLSIAAQGGQIRAGGPANSRLGSRWAATVAANWQHGPWTLTGQYIDYRYNVPGGRSYHGLALPSDSVTYENYGSPYQVPAAAQIFRASAGRSFAVTWGPVSSVSVYDDYGYLKVGDGGHYDAVVPGDGGARVVGDGQFNVAGVSLTADPVDIWLALLSGRDVPMSGIGADDGKWHQSVLLTGAFYFSGAVAGHT